MLNAEKPRPQDFKYPWLYLVIFASTDAGTLREVADTAALESALRLNLRSEVRFDNVSRALYATDGSNYRQVPIGVVLPRDTDDAIVALLFAANMARPSFAAAEGPPSLANVVMSRLCLTFRSTWRRSSSSTPNDALPACSPGSFSMICAAPQRNIT